ncbi:MAG: YceD family protein [Bacteroidales bacterium]
MKCVNTYNIAYESLSLGAHTYEYVINDDFFQQYGTEVIKSGRLNAIVKLDKHTSFMELAFAIDGMVSVDCDRCLDMYNQTIEFNGKLIVKFGDSNIDDGDDIIWIDKSEGILRLAKWLNEFIVLSLPIRKVHPEDKDGNSLCNQQMLAYLGCHGDEDDEDEQHMADSRWDALKTLKNREDN